MNFIEFKRPETPILPIQDLHSIQISYGKAQHPLSLKEMLEAITEGDFNSLHQLPEAIRDENKNPQEYFHDKDFLNKDNNKFKALLIRLNYLSACAHENLAGPRIKFVLNLIESLLLINVYHNFSPMNVEIEDIGPRDGFKCLIFTLTKDETNYNLLLRKDPYQVVINGIQCIKKVEQDAFLDRLLYEFGISLQHILNDKDSYIKNLQEVMSHFPAEAQVNEGYRFQPFPRIEPKKHVARFSYPPHSPNRASLQLIPARPLKLTPSELSIIFTGSIPRLVKGFKNHYIFLRDEHFNRLTWNKRQISQVTEAFDSFLVRPPNGCESQVIFSIFLLTQPRKTDSNSVLKFRENLLKKLVRVHLPSQNDLVHLSEDITFENRMKKMELLTKYDLISRCDEFSFFYINFRMNHHLSNFYLACRQVLSVEDADMILEKAFLRLINKYYLDLISDKVIGPTIEDISHINPDIARRGIKLLTPIACEYNYKLAGKLLVSLNLYNKGEIFDLLTSMDHTGILKRKSPGLQLAMLEFVFLNCSFTEKQRNPFFNFLDSYLLRIVVHPASPETAAQIKELLLPLLKRIHEKIKGKPIYNEKYLATLNYALSYTAVHLNTFTFIEATKQEFPNQSTLSLCSKVRDYFGGKSNSAKSLCLIQKYLKTKLLEKSPMFLETPERLDRMKEVIDELSNDEIIHYKSIFINAVDLHTDILCFMFDAFYSTHPKAMYSRKYLFNKDFSLTLIDLKVFDRFDKKIERLKEMDKVFKMRSENSENLAVDKPAKEKSEHTLTDEKRLEVLAKLQVQKKRFGRRT